MSEFSREIEISASPALTFAFVSNVANMPRYVPTTRHAELSSPGHVLVEGKANGATYADEGQIFVDPEKRVMRWGSGQSAYRGELAVGECGNGGARVKITLHFGESHGGVPDNADVEKSLDQSLERLRSALATAA